MQHIPMSGMLMFREIFEEKIQQFNPRSVVINEFEKAYIIYDSLILLVSFEKDTMPVCVNVEEKFPERINNPFFELPKRDELYYDFVIEEITHNDIGFRFKTKEFIRELEERFLLEGLQFDVLYRKFKGFQRIYWCPEVETSAERINRLCPELHIRERYDNWLGNLYNYIIYKFDGINGEIEYAVAYTQGLVRGYVNKMCDEYIKTGKFGTDYTRFANFQNFSKVMKSWKNLSRQERVEKHLHYYVIKEFKKEFDDTWRYADSLLEFAQNGDFEALQTNHFLKPKNKWITEEYTYNLTKKIFKEYDVIYQHRPFFLKSSVGGQMSYDIFISKLNIAIEYQGKQHFEPIDFFGGQEGFEKLKIRDAEKLKLSKSNGIKLIYINYWEDVNEKLIKEKVDAVLDDGR